MRLRHDIGLKWIGSCAGDGRKWRLSFASGCPFFFCLFFYSPVDGIHLPAHTYTHTHRTRPYRTFTIASTCPVGDFAGIRSNIRSFLYVCVCECFNVELDFREFGGWHRQSADVPNVFNILGPLHAASKISHIMNIYVRVVAKRSRAQTSRKYLPDLSCLYHLYISMRAYKLRRRRDVNARDESDPQSLRSSRLEHDTFDRTRD